MNSKKSLVTKIFGIGTIPIATLIIMAILCESNGVALFETTGNWIAFFRSAASVMLTTFALSINLNSGRFDFSLGSVSLVASIVSSMICIQMGLSTPHMLAISLVMGIILGIISGVVYVLIKLPPIIVSLGISLFYEGLAFSITDGYGVSFVSNAELTSFPNVRNYMIVMIVALAIIIWLFDYTRFGYEYKSLLSGQKVSVNTGIKEVPNAIACYAICGGLMGVVGFMSATNTGTIQMALNFGSIGVMFTAFLPMFIGGFIGRYCNEKIGYVLGAISTALISLMYARLDVDASVQQIITALSLVGFLIFLNNQGKLISLFQRKKENVNEV